MTSVTTSSNFDRLAKELFIQLLRETGCGRMKVFGHSMLPTIRPGDVVQVESGPANPGDIIVFDRAGNLCVHRLLTTVDCQAISRGDANPGIDRPFPFKKILGRVTSLERNGTCRRGSQIPSFSLSYHPQ